MIAGRITCLVLCTLALLSSCSGAKDVDDTSVDSSETGGEPGLPGCEGMGGAWEALVDSIEEEMAEAGVPGAAVAVVCGGRLAYAGAWGSRGGAGEEPVTPATRFQLASLTKMFTAATALDVVEEGVVALDEPVNTYVPYASARGPGDEAITLHQLLSHTAGYPTSFSGGSPQSMELAGYFASYADHPLWSPPGEVYNYSNLGMALAGLALEEAAGEPFADLVESRIFGPAGMNSASMHASDVEDEGNFAFGHSGSSALFTEVAPTDSYLPTGYYGPMGGAWGSVLDLAAWGEAHLSGGGGALEPASMEALSTPWTETRRVPEQHYGYGHYIDRIYGVDQISHSGSVAGYLGHWMVVPEAGFGVFSLVNCDWFYPGTLGSRALELFVGPEAPDLTPYWTSQGDWPSYEGTYNDPHVLGRVEVLQEGTTLVARFEDLGFESELLGIYEDVYQFTWQPTGTPVSGVFWRDEPLGDAQYLVTLLGVAARQE